MTRTPCSRLGRLYLSQDHGKAFNVDLEQPPFFRPICTCPLYVGIVSFTFPPPLGVEQRTQQNLNKENGLLNTYTHFYARIHTKRTYIDTVQCTLHFQARADTHRHLLWPLMYFSLCSGILLSCVVLSYNSLCSPLRYYRHLLNKLTEQIAVQDFTT